MSATVTVCGEKSSSFPVTNGLRQGCTIAPTLFILYFDLVIRCWHSRCLAVRVEVQYRIGGKLVEERTRRPLSFTMSECLFADDAAIPSDMIVAAKIFEEAFAGWRLTLSVLKTKLLVAGVELSPVDVAPLQLNGGAVEVVREFKYLGSLVEASGRMIGEIDQCIVRATKAFGSLCSAVFLDKEAGILLCGAGSAVVWCRNMGIHTGFS